MNRYEDIDQKQEDGILGFRNRILPSESWRRFRNDARKAANSIHFSEEEILVIAANRLSLIKPAPSNQRPWMAWLSKVFFGARDDFMEVNGQELIVLTRLAGMEKTDQLIPHHSYRVRVEYFKHLYLRATDVRRTGSGKI